MKDNHQKDFEIILPDKRLEKRGALSSSLFKKNQE
jgi:hypothetical protein